ncbi:MAG: P-II family nitrogen regulator [Ruminococcaceae bacterium]|nr:P-II family nitrogen regulator [Oscillospiraceae bacterium]
MELNFLISVLDRDRADEMTAIYKEHNLPMVVTFLGRGTARSEELDLYGLQATEKAVVTAVADGEKTKQIMRSAKRKLFIDIPGNGVMMAVPVKSVGGGRTLAYLTDNTAPEGGAPQMQFDHELLVVILNQSYMDDVMNAARSAGAFGGTVLHAKGTGAKYAEKFFGVSLANEKEVILIASRSSEKAAIMRAIMEQTGPHTPAGAITFSLPISSVAGLRSVDKD